MPTTHEKKNQYFKNKKNVRFLKEQIGFLWQTSGSNANTCLSIFHLQTPCAYGCQTSLYNFHSQWTMNLHVVALITFGCNPLGTQLNLCISVFVFHELDIFEELRKLILDKI